MELFSILANARLRRARQAEARTALALVQQRVSWMERRGIDQWPRDHYLKVFNLAYFERAALEGCLWLLQAEGAALACAVVLEQDARWKNKEKAPSYYVHNLASLPQYPGAGGRMLELLEEKTLHEGKTFLRLDCKTGALKINAYYRKRGYAFAGFFRSAVYNGNLRQKKVALPQQKN